jgi:hypothetical protein
MPSTFPKFRELPAELQLRIWNLALFPRVIEFSIIRQNANRTTQWRRPILPILNISGAHPVSLECHDSRNEALRKYKDDYRVSYHIKHHSFYSTNTLEQYPVYSVQYNPLRDTVVFSNVETLKMFYNFYDFLYENGPMADIRIIPIKSLALRGCQLPFHECHNVYDQFMRFKMFYITRMFELEEPILVNITVGPKWLSLLPPTTKESDRRIKEYVGRFEMGLKRTSEKS